MAATVRGAVSLSLGATRLDSDGYLEFSEPTLNRLKPGAAGTGWTPLIKSATN